MAKRKLQITTASPGVGKDDSQMMAEMHLFFNRPLSSLEWDGLLAMIEKAVGK